MTKHEVSPIDGLATCDVPLTGQQNDENQDPDLDLDRDLDASLATRIERDLTNRKLAQNQTELSRQISELRSAVEVQGEMIRRLVGMLEDGADRGMDGVMAVGTGARKEIGEGGMVKGKGREGESMNGHASASWGTGRSSMS